MDSADSVDITSYIFNYTNQDVAVPSDKVPDFLNNYFVNIAEKTRLVDDSDYETCYNDVNINLDFIPPTLEDIYCYMMEIDVNTSSCIEGISKILLDKIPSKFVHLFATSLYYSKFPMAWTCSYVTLIPKDGDKTLPGNWRPISQTIVFAKILEKIVHKQVLEYFLANNIITEYQYGFLPGKSTQEAVFNIVRYMYSTINQNKLMGMVFLDIAKAFNCIDHNTLYRKLRDIGMSDRSVDWFRSYLHRHQIVRYFYLEKFRFLRLSKAIKSRRVAQWVSPITHYSPDVRDHVTGRGHRGVTGVNRWSSRSIGSGAGTIWRTNQQAAESDR